MRFFLPLFAFVFALSALFQWKTDSLQAFSKEGCEGDCQKCHTINNQELAGILQRMKLPQAKVRAVQMSQVKGLWEVSFEDQGKPGIFYVDFSKKFLLPGPIVELESGRNKTSEKIAKIHQSRMVDFSKIPLEQALVMGDRTAPHEVAVFTCPDCRYCEKLHEEIKKVLQERKDIVFYIILFPLKIHKDAYWKSKSIICHRSIRMLEDAFAHKEIPRLECETNEIDSNIKLAEALGITGTPTLIMPDGRIHTGTMPTPELVSWILGNR